MLIHPTMSLCFKSFHHFESFAETHSFNDGKNASIVTASVAYTISAKRFDAPLFQN